MPVLFSSELSEPLTSGQSCPVAHCQLPVLSWQPLLCFVNRLRHFCLPYALRDDLLDKASSSDKQDCFGLSGVAHWEMLGVKQEENGKQEDWVAKGGLRGSCHVA